MHLVEALRIEVEVGPPITTGRTPVGEMRVIPFTGGRFEGPELRGRLLPGGTDWQRVREDGVLEIHARYMLETEVGEIIEVVSEGLRSASAEVLARLGAGEEVSPDAYYFRTFVRLTTGAARLADWNHRLFIGAGVRRARQVEITVYEVP